MAVQDGLRKGAGVYRYTYNNKEFNADFGLKLLDYGARWYDPATARWGGVDPLSEKFLPYSPYNYGLNDPLRFIDPDGRATKSCCGGDEPSEMGVYFDASREIQGIAAKVGSFSDKIYIELKATVTTTLGDNTQVEAVTSVTMQSNYEGAINDLREEPGDGGAYSPTSASAPNEYKAGEISSVLQPTQKGVLEGVQVSAQAKVAENNNTGESSLNVTVAANNVPVAGTSAGAYVSNTYNIGKGVWTTQAGAQAQYSATTGNVQTSYRARLGLNINW